MKYFYNHGLFAAIHLVHQDIKAENYMRTTWLSFGLSSVVDEPLSLWECWLILLDFFQKGHMCSFQRFKKRVLWRWYEHDYTSWYWYKFGHPSKFDKISFINDNEFVTSFWMKAATARFFHVFFQINREKTPVVFASKASLKRRGIF